MWFPMLNKHRVGRLGGPRSVGDWSHHDLVRDIVRQPKPTCLADIQGVAFNMHFTLVLKDLHRNELYSLLDIIY